MNRIRPRHNTMSQYQGVGELRRNGKRSGIWRAVIRIGGRFIHLGTSRSEIEMAERYDDAVAYVHGEDSHRNFKNRPPALPTEKIQQRLDRAKRVTGFGIREGIARMARWIQQIQDAAKALAESQRKARFRGWLDQLGLSKVFRFDHNYWVPSVVVQGHVLSIAPFRHKAAALWCTLLGLQLDRSPLGQIPEEFRAELSEAKQDVLSMVLPPLRIALLNQGLSHLLPRLNSLA